MKPTYFIHTLAAATAILPCASGAAHVYAGATDTNGTPGIQNGDALSFVSNSTGAAITTFAMQPATLSSVAPFSNLYVSTGITFTALAGTRRTWDPALNSGLGGYRLKNAFSSTAGSFLEVIIANVTGPAGATFGFWEASDTAPRTGFTTGTGVFGTGRFAVTDDGSIVSEPLYVGDGVNDGTGEPPTTHNGNPAVDPHGHIHGRVFTFDQPGTYTVSYVLSDRTGAQANSEPFVVTYAVPEPTVLGMLGASGILGAVLLRRKVRRTL
jgi:hypothetical protein